MPSNDKTVYFNSSMNIFPVFSQDVLLSVKFNYDFRAHEQLGIQATETSEFQLYINMISVLLSNVH